MEFEFDVFNALGGGRVTVWDKTSMPVDKRIVRLIDSMGLASARVSALISPLNCASKHLCIHRHV